MQAVIRHCPQNVPEIDARSHGAVDDPVVWLGRRKGLRGGRNRGGGWSFGEEGPHSQHLLVRALRDPRQRESLFFMNTDRSVGSRLPSERRTVPRSADNRA